LFFLFVVFKLLDLLSLGFKFQGKLPFFLFDFLAGQFFNLLNFCLLNFGLPVGTLLFLFGLDTLLLDFGLGLFFYFSLDFIDILCLNFFDFFLFMFNLIGKIGLFPLSLFNFSFHLLFFGFLLYVKILNFVVDSFMLFLILFRNVIFFLIFGLNDRLYFSFLRLKSLGLLLNDFIVLP
jgi:hypothetical protein